MLSYNELCHRVITVVFHRCAEPRVWSGSYRSGVPVPMIASRAGMAGHSSSYFPYVKLVILILYIRQSPIIGHRLTMELYCLLMKMTDKYGFRIAEHCSDKGIRQAYLSMAHGCLISVSNALGQCILTWIDFNLFVLCRISPTIAALRCVVIKVI